jgi:hypothetical protein
MGNHSNAWTCERGHVMGTVQQGNLLLYRQAITPSEPTEAVDVIAVVEGYVANVRCSICGAMRTWFPVEAAMAKLLTHYARRRKVMG